MAVSHIRDTVQEYAPKQHMARNEYLLGFLKFCRLSPVSKLYPLLGGWKQTPRDVIELHTHTVTDQSVKPIQAKQPVPAPGSSQSHHHIFHSSLPAAPSCLLMPDTFLEPHIFLSIFEKLIAFLPSNSQHFFHSTKLVMDLLAPFPRSISYAIALTSPKQAGKDAH